MGERISHAFPAQRPEKSGGTGADGSSKHWLSAIHSPILLVYGLAAVVAILLPFVYDIIIRASVPDDDYGLRHELHIALCVLASLFSLIIIFNANGDFQHRLKVGLLGVSINFGTLILITVALRLYYSRPLLIASFFASIALVSTFNILIERYRKRRIGIVPGALTDEIASQVDSDAVVIASPDEPVWAYDVVLIDWARTEEPEWLRFATRAILSGCEVHHIAAHIERRRGRVVAEHFELDHAAVPRNSLYVLFYKRILDVVLVVLLAPLMLPVLAVGAALVGLTMGRPILYAQKRLGVDGRAFTMYKLRTMKAAKEDAPVMATQVGDARITPLGRVLRRFRIDELPQLYNILVGDMSLIGPRPEQPELAEAYTTKWPQFGSRTTLRPGITGWAQVRSSYAATDAETKHKLAYDLYYLKHASLMMDLTIMLQTVRTLLTGNSAR